MVRFDMYEFKNIPVCRTFLMSAGIFFYAISKINKKAASRILVRFI